MKNVKVKFNDANLKKTISNNVAHISCPKCGQKLDLKLNCKSVTCYNCGQVVNYDSTKMVNDVVNAFKKSFK